MRTASLAALAVGACTGNVGTIAIEVETAPGSTVMDEVVRVRMVLSNPYTVVEAERGPGGGFELAMDVVAEAVNGEVLLEGFDAGDQIVAYGRTPPLPIAAVDATITIYVGAPLSLAEAPMPLPAGRTEIGASLLDYGVLLAGGRDASGAPTRDLVVYNAYDHEVQPGLDLPAARAGVTVGTGITGYAYLFGGEDQDGDPTASIWRFDTTQAPSGAWLQLDEVAPALARAGAAIGPLGSDAFLIGGAPPLLLEGLLLRVTPFEVPSSLEGGIASVQIDGPAGSQVITLVAGEGAGPTGLVRLAGGDLDEEDAPPEILRTGHAVVPTVDDRILVVGGADDTGPLASAVDCEPLTRRYTVVDDLLATPRTEAAIATTSCCLVVAGGRDAAGEIVTDAEIFNVRTLAPMGVVPMVVPRAGAVARGLPNQQVIIVGGEGASGAPVDTIELFTPPPPTDL